MVSVIVPVYNAELWLNECIDSILNQTYSNIELICVDDGSTDTSLEILKKYQKSDNRVHIHTQPNRFAGAARNLGIEKSSGHYLTFLDSDDAFVPNAIEKMVKIALDKRADIVRTSAFNMNFKWKTIEWTLNKDYVKEGEVFNWRDKAQNIFCISSGNPWGMLIDRALIMDYNLRFLTTRVTEDIGFTYMAYLHANRIAITYEELVSHRITESGLEGRKSKYPQVPMQARKLLLMKVKDEGYYPYTYQGFWFAAIESYYQVLKRLIASSFQINTIKQYYDAIRAIPKEHADLVISTKNCPPLLKNKIQDLEDLLNSRSFFTYCSRQYIKRSKKIIKHTGDQLKNSWNSAKLSVSDFKTRAISIMDRKKTGPLFSVIIPVYNAEPFLDQCLNHLNKQNYPNIEIICVDDGSSDKSCEIINKHKESNQKIKLLHQENMGAGIARNYGLNECSGEYVLFLDADDWIDYNFFSVICTVFDKELTPDIIMFQHERYDNITKKRTTIRPIKGNKMLNLTNDHKELINNLLVTPWNKVYKRSLLVNNKLEFPDLKCANDRPFYFEVLSCAKQIYNIDKVLIHYRVNNSHSIIGINRTLNYPCHFNAFDLVAHKYKKMGTQYYSELVDVTVGDCFHFLDRSPNKYKPNLEKQLCEFIKRAIEEVPYDYTAYVWYKRFLKMDYKINNEIDLGTFTKLAETGDVEAMFILANAYATGKGATKSIEQAKNWYLKAYNSGHKKSGCKYATILLEEKNYEESAKLLQNLANDGEAEALFRLARMFRDGQYYGKDDTKAIELMRKASEKKYVRAKLELAELLLKTGINEDYSEAITILLKLANDGDKDAAYRLALTVDNPHTKIKWLEIASKNGHRTASLELAKINKSTKIEDIEKLKDLSKTGNKKASVELARIYLEDNPDGRDLKESLKLYKSYMNDSAVAMELADAILREHITNEYPLAFEIYIKQSENDNRNAMFKLYRMYKDGVYVGTDKEMAIKYLRLASSKGHVRARFEYAEYLLVNGSDEEINEAINMLMTLSNENDKDAMFKLGNLYEKGTYVEKNLHIAQTYYAKALKNGHNGAEKSLKRVDYLLKQ